MYSPDATPTSNISSDNTTSAILALDLAIYNLVSLTRDFIDGAVKAKTTGLTRDELAVIVVKALVEMYPKAEINIPTPDFIAEREINPDPKI